jgi:ABC-type Mn2+/Zn2+ transport system permease subunit
MTRLWDRYEKAKMALSGMALALLLVVYADFVRELGEMYPDIILDEIVSGFLGIGLVVLLYRLYARPTR